MADRLLITLLVLGGLSLLWWGWGYYKAKLIRTVQPHQQFSKKPALLYFTAQYCAACHYQQSPIIDQIVAKFGDAVDVKKYDVSQHPDLASQYRVLTLPTTVIVDQGGRVAHVNYGVTPQTKLETQLS